MRFITIGNAYINVESIESIEYVTSQYQRTLEVTTRSGKVHKIKNSNDISKEMLRKVLDKSGGYKEQ